MYVVYKMVAVKLDMINYYDTLVYVIVTKHILFHGDYFLDHIKFPDFSTGNSNITRVTVLDTGTQYPFRALSSINKLAYLLKYCEII